MKAWLVHQGIPKVREYEGAEGGDETTTTKERLDNAPTYGVIFPTGRREANLLQKRDTLAGAG